LSFRIKRHVVVLALQGPTGQERQARSMTRYPNTGGPWPPPAPMGPQESDNGNRPQKPRRQARLLREPRPESEADLRDPGGHQIVGLQRGDRGAANPGGLGNLQGNPQGFGTMRYGTDFPRLLTAADGFVPSAFDIVPRGNRNSTFQ
jgi:hypothetical protein